jgi:erythromycin esterase-like protein
MFNKQQLVDDIRKYAIKFSDATDLRPLVEQASNAKYVLLGEASHGTSEYYAIRTDITKQLIENHDFNFIAVEGDWPACYEVNRYIKGVAPEYKSAEDVLKKSFNRWPSWMWANHEIVELVEWLYNYNQNQFDKKIGFYGLDVYSLWESMESIIGYLKKNKSPNLEKALNAIECFDPYNRKPEMYGISAAFHGEDCLNEVIELLHTIHKTIEIDSTDPESNLSAKINSIVVANSEHYYHTMVTNDNESWNIRDEHMVEALEDISDFYGAMAKGIVWEHNTHIGDARATDMANENMVNVGQLTRERYGKDQVFAIGFGTYQGSVIASNKWGGRVEVMPVPEGGDGSWEEAIHLASPRNQYLIFTEENKNNFRKVIGHRAIGVVYNPNYEHYGNYVPSMLSERYDAFIHVDETTALKPL